MSRTTGRRSPIHDPRVEAEISGWRIKTWDGQPLGPEDFSKSSNKLGYDKMVVYYDKVASGMWDSAWKLYTTAKKHGLNVSEGADKAAQRDFTEEELKNLKELKYPAGYSMFLSPTSRREKYNNGFWVRELVFQDILDHSGLDRSTLQKLYYTGEIDRLCTYINDNVQR